MNKLKQCVVAGVALFGAVQAWGATDLVANGGFEEGCNPSSSGWKYRYHDTAIYSGAAAAEWTLLNASGISHATDETWVHAGYEGKGEVVCFLQATTDFQGDMAAVQQPITVSEAGRYTLTFDYVARGESTAGLILTVYVDDTSVWSATLNNTSWAQAVQNIELTSGSHTLKFVGTHPSSSSKIDKCGCIDNVSLTPASPVEVSDWATLKSNLSAGYDVKLVGNITQNTEQPGLSGSQNVTLDLNGYTIDRTSVSATVHFMRTDSANVTLTITDSSADKTGRVVGDVTKSHGTAGECLRVNSGKVIINGGTFEGMYSYNNGGCAYIASGATLEMNGGTITGCKTISNGGAIYNNGGTFTMNGGTIENCTATWSEGVTGYGGGIYTASGTCNLNAGTITDCGATQGGAYAAFGGTCNIYSGMTINSTVASGVGSVFVQKSGATVNVYGGTFTGTASWAVTAWEYATANVYGGYFDVADSSRLFRIGDSTAHVYVSGGVCSSNPDSNTYKEYSSGYSSTVVGSKYVVGQSVSYDLNNKLTGGTYTFCPTNAEYEATGIVDASKVAATGSNTSYTLNANDAVEVNTWAILKANIDAGNSVKLIADMTQTSMINPGHAKAVTLDLNGHTVSAGVSDARFFLVNNWYLTVKGEGVFDGSGHSCNEGHFVCVGYTSSASGFTMEPGVTVRNMTSVQGSAYRVYSGYLTINGGTVSNCVATTGNGGAIYNDGTVTMNGGTIVDCATSAGGGGIYHDSGTLDLVGGVITNCSAQYGGGVRVTAGTCNLSGTKIVGCKADRNGNGIQCHGSCTFNMTGGEIVGCGDIDNPTSNLGGALLIWDQVTANIYGGIIANNASGGSAGAIAFKSCSSLNIYGGVFSNNVGTAGKNLLWRYNGSVKPTVNGGLFDEDPTTSVTEATLKSVEKVGSNYIVGQSIAYDSNNQLTAGTYTFCPTNAEYEAAGLAVKEDKIIREIPTTPAKYVVGDPASLTMEEPVETVAGSGIFAAETTVQGDITVISVTVTDGKLNLTQVSGDGFTFKNGVVSSTEGHATPQVGVDYTSVQLSVTSAAAATTAMNSIRYVKLGLDNSIKVSATSAATLADGDYYLNGHYYTLSPTTMYWKDAMEWAYNLQNTSGYTERYPGYRSYPVTVTSEEENSMMVTIWANAHSGYKTQVWLPAVPKNFSSGTSIVVGGSEGARTVTVTGVPYAYENDTWTRNGKTITEGGGIYGMGERYVWMTGVPESGEELPAESNVYPNNGTYWSAQNPYNRGVIYFGHPNYGAVWDDLDPATGGSNAWTSFKEQGSSFHMYALAEWEPYAGFEPEEVETEVSATFVTVTIPTVEHTTYTNVTVGATSVTPVNNVITVASGTTITVYYKADYGYELTGDTTAVLTNVTEDHKTIDTSKVTVAKAAYLVEADEDSEYEPTQIVNGGFDDEAPWMDFTLNGVRQTRENQTSAAPLSKAFNIVITPTYPNGVDEGWNTTEDRVQYGTLFQNISASYSASEWRTISNMTYSSFQQYKADALYNESVAKGYGNAVEMNALQAATLYQDLTTYGGDVIRWTLSHGAYPNRDHPMIVSVGAPERDDSGNIIAASGVGAGNIDNHIVASTKAVYDSTGVTGYSGGYGIASELEALHLSQTQTTQWYTCKGVYVIPEEQSVTRFAFESQSETPEGGNLLDNVTFSTLIGNLKALVNDDGSVTITGYWGDSDTSKKLMVKIGDGTADAVDMSNVLNQNFKITVSSDKIGSANVLEVYHQDYESAKRTVTIGYAVTLNLNADDAKCTKLETYQRGVVTVLPIPTRTGYAFKGWFENAELTGTAVTQIEATATGAKTFYAKWQGPLIQVGDDAWAWVTNGLCEITGTTATWDFTTTANPLDSYSRAITNIVVCDGVTELGAYTFYKFYYATNITFAASVTNLCAGALFRCLSFENVTFEGTLPNMEDDNALVIHAGIKMEGGKPVVYAVPNVTVNGQSLILKGKDKLTDAEWQTVTSGEEENYHFFKFVAE